MNAEMSTTIVIAGIKYLLFDVIRDFNLFALNHYCHISGVAQMEISVPTIINGPNGTAVFLVPF
jgi:hypothetical protein